MLDGTAVKAVGDYAQGALAAREKTVEVEGRTYSTVPLTLVQRVKEQEPAPLVVHTLSGFRDYINENRDGLPLNEMVVHVEGPELVSLRSSLTGACFQRYTFLKAENYNRFASFPSFRFGQFFDREALQIAVMALFTADYDQPTLLRLLGHIRDVSQADVHDDGVTQTVNMKAGMVLAAKEAAPTLLTLAPYRTFPEITDQPLSRFFLRIKKQGDGEGAVITAALFEADGGAWQGVAIRAVRDWLGTELPPQLAIIA